MTSAGAMPLHSPLDERTALKQLVARACQSALQTPGTGSRADALRLAARGLNTAVQESILQLARTLNDRAPVNQLPRELFLRILGRVRLRDRIAATLVCQHWRAVAICAPDLWCCEVRAFCRNGAGLDRAFALLARSGGAPVSLHLFVSGPCDALGDLLREHMYHTALLDLRLDFEFTRGDYAMLIQPVLRALTEPAPVLQDLRIQINRLPRAPAEDTYFPDALFSQSAPFLESVVVHGLAIHPRAYAAFSAVRILHIGQVEVDFLRVVELYPRLQQLHVSTLRLVSSGGGRTVPVPAPTLELLEIRGSVQAAEMVSTQLRCARPVRVWMDLTDEAPVRYILESHTATLRAVRLYIQFPILARGLELSYDSGNGMSWMLGPTVDTPVWALLEPRLAHVETLALHELQWPLHLETVELPRLARLEIVLDSFAVPSSSHMATYTLEQRAGILYADESSALHCPVLEELSFATPVGADYDWTPLTVDVDDVYNFIATRLRIAGRPLARLVLRNVRLEDPERGAGTERLTALVCAIEYRSAGPPQIPELHKRASTMMGWVYSMIG